ncbi:MAG: MFS transporter [Thermodesulfobacteriota bacterium]|nr:MFS transporter [Thermodesulfobacteriota bacterium]
MDSQRKTDLKNSIYDGIFAHMFATLTGGVFLTGFAIHLGMNEFLIGILGSIPFFVTIFQLPTSYFILKNFARKKIAYRAASFARLLWLPIVLLAFLPVSHKSTQLLLIISLIFLSHAFISISYISWLSWISDLVPDEIRGRFFGTRNMICGIAGMIVMVVFGILLDRLKIHSPTGVSLGFFIIFIAAVSFGILSLRFLKHITEPSVHKSFTHISFQRLTLLPFEDSNFKRFLFFSLFWNFSVYFASPFFTLYFLRDLNFSYGFVATLGMISAFADLLGMRVWGRISDRVKNKAVIQFSSWFAIALPLAWTCVQPDNIFIPILLHLIGGGFWAGINLCTNNLVLRISPHENRAFFFSVYNIMGGLGAAIGPVLAGLLLKSMTPLNLELFSWQILPLQIIFIASTLFRFLSFQLFKFVKEPEEFTVGEMVRVIRGIRGLNTANGFNHILHPFIEAPQKHRNH